jgi:hypothetical protein
MIYALVLRSALSSTPSANKPPKSRAITATCLALVLAALRGCPTRLIET